MSKGFKIFLVIFVLVIGYIIPVFIIDNNPGTSLREKEIRNELSFFENLLVLKVAEGRMVENEKERLYTWFGFKYGTVKTIRFGGSDLVGRYASVLSRFWTKKDTLLVLEGEDDPSGYLINY